ncbi:TBC1 domain family member 13 protein [Pelomyxa schiedti]|nr:TBC1 domain family member 13 protein [Pelomyxa schiedti]
MLIRRTNSSIEAKRSHSTSSPSKNTSQDPYPDDTHTRSTYEETVLCKSDTPADGVDEVPLKLTDPPSSYGDASPANTTTNASQQAPANATTTASTTTTTTASSSSAVVVAVTNPSPAASPSLSSTSASSSSPVGALATSSPPPAPAPPPTTTKNDSKWVASRRPRTRSTSLPSLQASLLSRAWVTDSLDLDGRTSESADELQVQSIDVTTFDEPCGSDDLIDLGTAPHPNDGATGIQCVAESVLPGVCLPSKPAPKPPGPTLPLVPAPLPPGMHPLAPPPPAPTHPAPSPPAEALESSTSVPLPPSPTRSASTSPRPSTGSPVSTTGSSVPVLSMSSSSVPISGDPPKLSKFEARVAMFKGVASAPICDLQKLRALAFSGIPDSVPGIRSTFWKLLLNYLPVQLSERETKVLNCRKQYWELFHELIVHPESTLDQIQRNKRHPVRVPENMTKTPVFEVGSKHGSPDQSIAAQSTWKQLFTHNETWEQIDKDVKRTLPDMHFFENVELHQSLQHILFIYAKLNPRVSYVQGMNEIAGRIFYVFASDRDPDTRDNAEADAFFCFTNLMTEILEFFTKTLDGDCAGVEGWIVKLDTMLLKRDPVLWHDLQNKGVDPHFYGFRWITLLLSQEFELPDVLRLWDSFLSDEKRFSFVIYFCCAMLLAVRERLLSEAFAENVHLLQNYPIIGFDKLFELAAALRDTPIRFSDGDDEETDSDDPQGKKKRLNPLALLDTSTLHKSKNRLQKTLRTIHHKTVLVTSGASSSPSPDTTATSPSFTPDPPPAPPPPPPLTLHKPNLLEFDLFDGTDELDEYLNTQKTSARTTWCSGARPILEEKKKSFL